ncbi:MAG: ABC transporter ATP-binding protein [Candidatus Bipolaricaulota bacterium]|nr:ABC transporter ATP-binding protein [Candidatus Bipolaricaulota bacterium]MDW8126511.1 ABC transporter ATP-binding protein [Candidatus Bipolaricaulota bacterium]
MSLIGRELFYAYVSGQFVLVGVNVEVERGEVLFLLGANGSGKTTLLECLCGVRVPQRGEVSLDGKRLSSLSARERAKYIAYVPQFPETTFAYTVEEMILMGRAPHIGPFGQPGPKDREKVEEVLALIGLEALRGRPVNALSGGEKRLVLIARGLAQEAPYLLLDEPDAHLDPANQHRVLSVICRLAKTGLGVAATTHNPNSALLYAQRVLLLRSGKTLAHGDPRQVLFPEVLTEAYGIAFQIVGDGSGPKAILPLVEAD